MERPQTGVDVGTKDIRQLGIAADIDKENDEDHGEESAGNFENTAGSPPAAPFLVVEDGLAFGHESIQARRS